MPIRALARIYGQRHDMFPMLRSARAAGRPYVLYATDEAAPAYYNFVDAPAHVVALRTEEAKLGVYAKWEPGTTTIDTESPIEIEFYDYATRGGVLELDNRPDDPMAAHAGGPVPRYHPHGTPGPPARAFRAEQALSEQRLIAYETLLANLNPLGLREWSPSRRLRLRREHLSASRRGSGRVASRALARLRAA